MKNLFLLLFASSFLMSCFAQNLSDNYDISVSSNGVIPMPSDAPAVFAQNGFVKYTKIQCPNGQAIHFVAQNQVSDAMIVHCRTLLEFYLTDYPGSEFGADKTAVKNQMGTNNAMIMLPNGSHQEGNEPNIPAQSLYQNEISIPGSAWYQNNNYEHRDASFEEILHLMHDTGIGVDGANSSPGALPAYQTEIRAAQNNAILNNYAIWPRGAAQNPGWFNELSQENSLSQEYLASVVDSYYGLWEPWTESTQYGMWGEYIAKTREEIATEDPMGAALMPKYFSPYINVDMIIDPEFNGTFSLTRNPANPYTFKSQYLQHVYLTGTNASNLQGNDQYNRLKGNSANNSFEGLKGNDRLDGQGGQNTAVFTGTESEYTVNNLTDYAIVTDLVADRDGVDTLWNIQNLQFSDGTTPIDLTSTVSLEKIELKDQVSVYPNPASEFVQLVLPSEMKLTVFSPTGKILQSKSVHSNEKISLATYPKGVIIFHFENETGKLVKRIIHH